jgi:hypothetical protein
MKQTSVYKPKALIDGEKIQQVGQFVAIPDRHYKDKIIRVEYKGVVMTIEDWGKATIFKKFHDKFRQGEHYTLAYFPFIPDL